MKAVPFGAAFFVLERYDEFRISESTQAFYF